MLKRKRRRKLDNILNKNKFPCSIKSHFSLTYLNLVLHHEVKEIQRENFRFIRMNVIFKKKNMRLIFYEASQFWRMIQNDSLQGYHFESYVFDFTLSITKFVMLKVKSKSRSNKQKLKRTNPIFQFSILQSKINPLHTSVSLQKFVNNIVPNLMASSKDFNFFENNIESNLVQKLS